jgi:recombination protein RecA
MTADPSLRTVVPPSEDVGSNCLNIIDKSNISSKMDRAMTTIPIRPDTLPMPPSGEPLGSALARLEARWGSVAIRLGNGDRIGGLSLGEGGLTDAPTAITRTGAIGSRALGDTNQASEATLTLGALALAPTPAIEPDTDTEPTTAPTSSPSPRSTPDPVTEAVSTGFPALDTLLATGGLPRRAGATLRGDASSGKTTLALRSVAQAQAVGGIVAWLDGGWTFDPLEAAARGVDLQWLVVLRPADAEEGLRLAGALVSGRAVDLLVLDLPPRLAPAIEALLRRLAAHARRIGVQLLVLEPLDLAAPIHGALAEAAGVRLELERVGWLRLGRDIVGQRTAVTVAKNRFGPPGRQVELEIHYLDDGERAAGVSRLLDASPTSTTGPPRPRPVPSSPARSVQKPPTPLVTIDHAPFAPRLAQPPAPPRARPTGPALDADGAARPGRPSVGSGQRPRPKPGRGPFRRPAGAAAGGGTPARP